MDTPDMARKTETRLLLWGMLPLCLAMFLSWRPVVSGDIWMHLATAREMVNTGSIPHTAPFLYNTDEKTPFINHSWGMQLIFYGAYSLAGVDGLIATLAAFTGITALLLYSYAVERGASPATAAITSAAIFTIASRFLITRPLIIAPLISAAMLLLLLKPTRARVLASLGLLVLWANMHASFLLGIAIMFIIAAEWSISSRLLLTEQSESGKEGKMLWAAALASPLLCLLNPNGTGLYKYVYDIQNLTWIHDTILEWMPPDWGRTSSVNFLAASILVIALNLAAIISRRKVALAPLALFALLFWQSFDARRFMLNASLIAIPVAAVAVSAILESMNRAGRAVVNIVLAAILAALVIGTFPSSRSVEPEGNINKRYIPVKATEFIKAQGITGNIANTPYSGGYLLWACPEVKPATDGRCLVNNPQT
ncbi:MAG: hypothetical protein JXR97_15245, partial [Planctomycetes bacterium]|nr:hypothetical protein [Planctomycetota bacterium]